MDSDGPWQEAGSDRTISMAEIDRSEERFRITTRRDSGDLQSSIRRFGLRAAPLVVPGESGFVVVSGFRRMHACRRLGREQVPVRVLRRGASAYACALLAVAENTLERSLNPIETSRALTLLEQHAPGGRLPPEDAAALGLPVHPVQTARLKRLGRMPVEVQTAVLEGALAPAMADMLGGLEEGLGIALALLFRRLRPSLNKQREIVIFLLEIAAREETDPKQVLEQAWTGDAERSGDQDPNQQIHGLRQCLRRRRFPELARAEENFQALRRRLKLGDALQLTPPRDFEGTRLTLSLSFETLDDVVHLRAKLDELIDHRDFHTLLKGKARGFDGSSIV